MIPKSSTSARRAIIAAPLVSLLAAALLSASAQKTRSLKQPAPVCKISPIDAIRIALQKVPGRALNANFEFDEGKWVYGVMIVSGKTVHEVELDPITGKVEDTETVTPEGEASELKAELTKAVGGAPALFQSGKAKETEKE